MSYPASLRLVNEKNRFSNLCKRMDKQFKKYNELNRRMKSDPIWGSVILSEWIAWRTMKHITFMPSRTHEDDIPVGVRLNEMPKMPRAKKGVKWGVVQKIYKNEMSPCNYIPEGRIINEMPTL
jgi:hypothetical protein